MRNRRFAGRCLAALVLLGVLAFEPAAAVRASNTFTVNTLTDATNGSCTSTCTLRDAITEANAMSPASIGFSVAGGIYLTTYLPEIANDMSINGPGANVLAVISLGDMTASSIFHVRQGSLSISGLTITGGSSPLSGGGIFVADPRGVLTLSDVTVTNNAAVLDGGGIFSNGP